MSTNDEITPDSAKSIVLQVEIDVNEKEDAFLEDLAKKFSEAARSSPSNGNVSANDSGDMFNKPLVSPVPPSVEKKAKKYVRFSDRAKRALKPLAGKKSSNKKERSPKLLSSPTHPSSIARESNDTQMSDRVSVPVSLISKEAFSKIPSQDEMKQELERMRNPFPNVPKYAGNPPWVTRYHPDLIRTPTKKSS